ncbi:MAG: hypothetical protein ABFD96_05810 [Armatimonadia bacterium]
MRIPTPRDEAYRWHTEALKGVYGDADAPHPDEPQCGWFKRTLARGGVFVPARIWLFQDVDPKTGQLLDDELLQCEVDGMRRDAYDEWSWLCRNPITEAEFDYLTALRRHAVQHEPDLPIANPRKPVDWLRAPLPQFRKD